MCVCVCIYTRVSVGVCVCACVCVVCVYTVDGREVGGGEYMWVGTSDTYLIGSGLSDESLNDFAYMEFIENVPSNVFFSDNIIFSE